MADAHQLALRAYDTICRMLDNRQWKYTRHDDDLVITCGVRGDDLPMDVIFKVREQQQVVSLISPLPFKMAEDKRVDGALAVCVANYGLINGSFDYDLSDGEIRFRMVSSFRDCELSEDVFNYMLICSVGTVDDYNDKFMMLSKGMMTIQQFIEQENSNS